MSAILNLMVLICTYKILVEQFTDYDPLSKIMISIIIIGSCYKF